MDGEREKPPSARGGTGGALLTAFFCRTEASGSTAVLCVTDKAGGEG